MSQSDIQLLYGLLIDNGIQQYVNCSRIGIFKNKFVVHGQYIRFPTMLLISVYQKWQCCYVKKSCSVQAAKMECSQHVNWNSIIYRKISIHRTEIKRPFLVPKAFNTNLVQFLLPYHVIISNVHGCARKMVLHAWNIIQEKV